MPEDGRDSDSELRCAHRDELAGPEEREDRANERGVGHPLVYYFSRGVASILVTRTGEQRDDEGHGPRYGGMEHIGTDDRDGMDLSAQ